jgi:hypothetical protein
VFVVVWVSFLCVIKRGGSCENDRGRAQTLIKALLSPCIQGVSDVLLISDGAGGNCEKEQLRHIGDLLKSGAHWFF